MPVRSWVKKKGRPKHWLTVRPPHLTNAIPNHEFILNIEDSQNQWRELCRNGATYDYFELLDITDPTTMGDGALSWETAVKLPKYREALKKINEAKKRNAQQINSIALKGARNSQLNAESRRELLIEYLYAEFYTVAEYHSRSIRGWANQIITKEARKPAARRWDGGRINKPGLTHLRGILKKIRDDNQDS